MRVLDLFSGIGGFALGLESVGMETVAFCEHDGYARRVLKKNWPGTWIYEDVRTLTARRLRADGVGPIDLICGGFPCQDISCAGKGAGIDGARSGLWSEYHRLIREVRPRWVLAENVPALRGRGADRVLGDLERAGYTAWPFVVGAVHAGAPHRRQRAWIVAHAAGARCPAAEPQIQSIHALQRRSLSHAAGAGRKARSADGMGEGQPGPGASPQHGGWHSESGIRRVADGVPARVDRLRCLGNAVVPQVVAMIGRAILDADFSLMDPQCRHF